MDELKVPESKTSRETSRHPAKTLTTSTGEPQHQRFEMLCQRAERLIDSVRMAHQQVDAMFNRPDRIISDANATAQALLQLREELEPRVDVANRIGEACEGRITLLQRMLIETQQATQGIVQRVQRARQLAEMFTKMIDGTTERIEMLRSTQIEAAEVREAVKSALGELADIRSIFEVWQQNHETLEQEQKRLIDVGQSATAELLSATEAADGLTDHLEENAAVLEALLERSHQERQAWEKFFSRLPVRNRRGDDPSGEPLSSARSREARSVSRQPPPTSFSGPAVPDPLVRRIRRLGKLVQKIGNETTGCVSGEAIPAVETDRITPTTANIDPVTPSS